MDAKINTEIRLAKMEEKIDNLIEDIREIGKDIKQLDTNNSGKLVEYLTHDIAGCLVVYIVGGVYFLLLT